MYVRFLHSSSSNSRRCMAIPLRTTRINDDGITFAYDATMVRYGACMVKPVVPRAPTIACGLVVIMIINLGDNIQSVWRQGKFFL